MIGLRFFGDPFVPDARFETLKREFGDRFEAIEIDPKDAAPGPMAHPHSVLTLNLAEDDELMALMDAANIQVVFIGIESPNEESLRETKKYQTFSTPYTGLAQVLPPDEIYKVGQRFGLYRWHVVDPIRFEKDLRVTNQALGWQEGGRYLPLEDDIASVAYWYQTEPHAPFPKLPEPEVLKVGPIQVQK